MSVQLCFLTGRSDPGNTALSPAQLGFLRALPLADDERVEANFPYDEPTGPWRRTPLPLASVRNGRDHLGSRHPRFAERHADAVRERFARADRTLVLAGSCGLELLANLRLGREVLERVQVLAYGPVARRAPDVELEVVVGRADLLARPWAARADHVIASGHLDYLGSPPFAAIAERALARARAADRAAQPSAGRTPEVPR